MKIEITDHFPLTRVQLCAILASRELIDARIQALQQIKKDRTSAASLRCQFTQDRNADGNICETVFALKLARHDLPPQVQLLLRDELQLQVRTKYTPPAIQLNQVSTIPQPATPGTLNFAVRIIGVPLTITGCAEIENTENTRSTGSQENFVNTAAGIAISDSEPRENPEHHGNQNVCARNKSQLPHVTIKYLGEFNAQIPFLGKTIETAASKLIPEILRADHDLIMQIAKNKLPIFVAQQ